MNTSIERLRRLLATSGSNDWSISTPIAPLAPYGQHSDPYAALAEFQMDLKDLLEVLEILVKPK